MAGRCARSMTHKACPSSEHLLQVTLPVLRGGAASATAQQHDGRLRSNWALHVQAGRILVIILKHFPETVQPMANVMWPKRSASLPNGQFLVDFPVDSHQRSRVAVAATAQPASGRQVRLGIPALRSQPLSTPMLGFKLSYRCLQDGDFCWKGYIPHINPLLCPINALGMAMALRWGPGGTAFPDIHDDPEGWCVPHISCNTFSDSKGHFLTAKHSCPPAHARQ